MAAGLDVTRRRVSSVFVLVLDALLERAGADAPFGVGVAPPGAGAGAGRIDEHDVAAPRKVGEDVARPLAARAPARCGRRRAFEPAEDRRQAPAVVVGRVDLPRFSIIAASASVLPPAPAQRSSTCIPGSAPLSSAASCEPSSCTSTCPLTKAGSAESAGPRPSGLTAMRRPTGDSGVGCASRWASAASALSRPPLSVLTRRSTGARSASALPAATASSPKLSANAAASHSGKSPRTMVGRAGEVACSQPFALGLGERRRARGPRRRTAPRCPLRRGRAIASARR